MVCDAGDVGAGAGLGDRPRLPVLPARDGCDEALDLLGRRQLEQLARPAVHHREAEAVRRPPGLLLDRDLAEHAQVAPAELRGHVQHAEARRRVPCGAAPRPRPGRSCRARRSGPRRDRPPPRRTGGPAPSARGRPRGARARPRRCYAQAWKTAPIADASHRRSDLRAHLPRDARLDRDGPARADVRGRARALGRRDRDDPRRRRAWPRSSSRCRSACSPTASARAGDDRVGAPLHARDARAGARGRVLDAPRSPAARSASRSVRCGARAPSWLSDSLTEERRAGALAAAATVAGLGFTIGPVLAGVLADRFDTGTPFLVLACRRRARDRCARRRGAGRDRRGTAAAAARGAARSRGATSSCSPASRSSCSSGSSAAGSTCSCRCSCARTASPPGEIGLLFSAASAVYTVVSAVVARLGARSATLRVGGEAALLHRPDDLPRARRRARPSPQSHSSCCVRRSGRRWTRSSTRWPRQARIGRRSAAAPSWGS